MRSSVELQLTHLSAQLSIDAIVINGATAWPRWEFTGYMVPIAVPFYVPGCAVVTFTGTAATVDNGPELGFALSYRQAAVADLYSICPNGTATVVDTFSAPVGNISPVAPFGVAQVPNTLTCLWTVCPSGEHNRYVARRRCSIVISCVIVHCSCSGSTSA
jgi:hypothetical protein